MDGTSHFPTAGPGLDTRKSRPVKLMSLSNDGQKQKGRICENNLYQKQEWHGTHK